MIKNLKSLVLIMIFSCSLLLLFGCSEKKDAESQYEPFIIDVVNDVTNIKPELTMWNQEYFEREDVDKEKEVSFDDRTYKGKYTKSIIRKGESYTTDIYTDDKGVKIGFKENTDKLVLLNLMNNEFFDKEPFKDDIKNAEQSALSLAKNIASKYVNVNEYEILQEEPVTREKNKDEMKYYITYYTFTFVKKVNDVYSSDYLSVKITSKGNLASLYIGDLNVFDNEKKIDFSVEDINKVNSEKILDTYKSLGHEVLEQSISYQRLVITPEGKLALYSGIDIKLKLNGDEKIIESGICILSYIK